MIIEGIIHLQNYYFHTVQWYINTSHSHSHSHSVAKLYRRRRRRQTQQQRAIHKQYCNYKNYIQSVTFTFKCGLFA